MPFGLKNTDPTYQRLMYSIFKDVMGTDVEAYVDDMVVHQLKLNPEKCSFGVQAGKLLGFMLTERGIETNPEKCQVVVNIRSLQNVKEVQQLAALPNFQTLKKGGNFLWTVESKEAFLKMKAMLAAPPILTKSTLGTPLLVYLFVTDDAISRTIVQEKEGNQCLVYFISRVLQGPKKRYQKIEKATFALIVISRRICPYFQGYHIIIWTDLPIWQILRKSDLAGRMVGWSTQLFEGHIKVQALADFIIKLAPVGHPSREGREWFLFIDRASNQSESGVGVILESLDGVLVEQSLQFEFKASNNQAEYEALLVRMKLAKELYAWILIVKSDLKLVIDQDRAMKLVASFEKFTLLHVPREQNEKADLLLKLASTQRGGNN
ncbi:Retrovirus-related Pol polyprotein from transposon 17.6, partial [Mucuna pruriens]